MFIIGVQSIQSGAGASTVAAALAVALSEGGVRSYAMDLTTENALALMYGMPLDNPAGLLQSDLINTHIRDCMYENDHGLAFIPMGRMEPGAAAHLTARLDAIAANLTTWLQPLHEIGERILVVDTPREAGSLQNWVYKNAHLVLNVAAPEPRLIPALLEFEQGSLQRQFDLSVQSYVLVNGIAPHIQLTHDIADYLKMALSETMLLPLMIHKDQHVPEAFAKMQPLAKYAPAAQSTKDFAALALWLTKELVSIQDKE
ncbi:cellulose synthase operon protein YhjQ/BcsQ [Aliidiomarina taiwanensis]|uniref:cellulose synthase operon protein YhjQ/BcsQ n=1 Tax=Aliidiomarina taiwanensis TaxID=946228 RepID=UPI0013009FB9|nr:cellulose synthase operon protein YhjQ/BcsQ [Aliidiomarina taiwanensis]